MTLLNHAKKIYIGNQVVSSVYVGSQKVWPVYVLGPEERMLDNTAPTNPATGDFTLGAQFTPTGDGKITHIRYWNPDSSVLHKCSIWTVNDSVKRATVIDPAGSPLGYRELALSTPLDVTAGVAYAVGYSSEGGGFSYSSGLYSLAPHITVNFCVYQNGSDVLPIFNSGNFTYHADVVYRMLTLA